MKQIRRHLTYANVMSSLAVFLILGGATAFAATKKIGANEIKANSIKTGKIVKEAVTAGKIKTGAVTEGKIANGAVTSGKLGKEVVTTEKLGKEAVTTEKLAKEAVTDAKLKADAVTTNKLAGSAVTTAKLANTAVTQAKVGTDAIGSGQLKTIITRTGSTSIANGASGFATASCNPGEQAVGVGTTWNAFEANLYTNYARLLGPTSAQARGNNLSGATKTFTVEIYCLSN